MTPIFRLSVRQVGSNEKFEKSLNVRNKLLRVLASEISCEGNGEIKSQVGALSRIIKSRINAPKKAERSAPTRARGAKF